MQNLYYRTVYGRQNIIKIFVLDLFLTISSPFRSLIENFTRRNFGERYYSFSSSLFVALLLLIIPLLGQGALIMYLKYSRSYGGQSDILWDTISKYASWYIFTGAFIYFSYLRWKETKRNPSVFDFGKFSYSMGQINPAFFKFQIGGKRFDVRQIETLIEPALAFGIGLLLWLIGQNVGVLLMIASIVYSLSYFGAYYKGDCFVMDMIDEILMNEESEKSFVGDYPSEECRGVRFHARKPTSEDLRRKVASRFTEPEEEFASIS